MGLQHLKIFSCAHLAGEGDAVTGCTQERGRVGEALLAPQTMLPRRGPGSGSQRLWAEQDPCPTAPRSHRSLGGRRPTAGTGEAAEAGRGAPHLTRAALQPAGLSSGLRTRLLTPKAARLGFPGTAGRGGGVAVSGCSPLLTETLPRGLKI